MHYFKRITLACLVVSSLVPSAIVADNKERLLKRLEEEKKIEDSRRNVLAGLGILLFGTTIAVAANSNSPLLQKTGLGPGFFASSILLGLSYLSPENARVLRQAALVVPFLGMMGEFIHSDSMSGPNGLLKNAPLGIDKICINTDGEKSAAFTLLAGVGAYIVLEPAWKKLRSLVKSNPQNENN